MERLRRNGGSDFIFELNVTSTHWRCLKTHNCASFRFCGFDFTIAWRCGGHERIEQLSGRFAHRFHGVIESIFVGFRRLIKSAQFSHELN